jgi:hypothetical protein
MPQIFFAQRSYFFAPIFLRHKKTFVDPFSPLWIFGVGTLGNEGLAWLEFGGMVEFEI